MSTAREFEGYDAEIGAYAVGTLEVSAPDGSSWRLDADTGDAGTFLIEIADGRGTRTETLLWSDEITLPCLSPSDTSVTAAVRRRCEPIFDPAEE